MSQKRVNTAQLGQYEDKDPGDYVEGALKEIDDNFLELYPSTNQIFAGVISLSKDLTHYASYDVDTNIAITLKTGPIIGGSAEIRLVADGSHSPSFDAAFTKSASSADFDTTLNKVNKVVFYYDGTDAFYSITVL